MATCGSCSEKVYKAEEVTALGKSWHKSCFACQVCKKSMNPGDALDHDGFPYCKADYSRNFGPKGMIAGVVVDTGLGPMPEGSLDLRGARPDFMDPLKEKSEAKRTGVAESVVKGSAMTEAQLQAERNRQAIRAAERAFEDDDNDDDMSSRVASMRFADPSSGSVSGAKGKSYGGKQLAVGGGDSCRACGKAVGFADKITAMGGKWHKSCFTCAYCSKSFSSAGDAIEANGKPCCNPCFKKNHPSSRKN
jgi:cysteine/glycine-rich protein